MCGIGGILRTDGRRVLNKWLDAIDRRIEHRGPDGSGRFRDRVSVETPEGRRSVEVAFVHRRLSIIDHESGGQPMVSEQGRTKDEGLVAVVFNGCIYNHREVRRELETLGHEFSSDHSDTEVLIHGYREWGLDLPRNLEGMYAFALWDRDRARVVFGRDVFGRKPLFVADARNPQGRRCIVFASDARVVGEIAAEIQDEAEPPDDRLGRYLQTGFVQRGALRPDLRSGVDAPAPGSVWAATPHVDDDECAVHLVDELPGERDLDTFESLLDQAVARRLEADVPLGCFLSGGIDSSLVAYFAREHEPGLRTFGVRMPDPRFDESTWSERVAEHLGTDHTTLEVSSNPAEDLVQLVELMGQPFGDSSILPTYWVSRAARAHVTVALSGDGGDELFIGYERYLAARHVARHHRWFGLLPPAFGRRAHPKSLRARLGRLGHVARDYPAMGLMALETIFTGDQIGALLGGSPRLERIEPEDDAMLALRRHDVGHYLPEDLMRKVDVASMAVALEVRCPFLDRELAVAAMSTDADRLVPGGRRKGLLRQLASRHLPRAVVNRPKMGFAIPIGQWFRTDFGGMRTLLLDQLRSRDPFGSLPIDRTSAQYLVNEHLSLRADHGQRLFALLTLSLWVGTGHGD